MIKPARIIFISILTLILAVLFVLPSVRPLTTTTPARAEPDSPQNHIETIGFYGGASGLRSCYPETEEWRSMTDYLDKMVELEVNTLNGGPPFAKQSKPQHCLDAYKEYLRQAHTRGLKITWILSLNYTYWFDPDHDADGDGAISEGDYCKSCGPWKWNPERAREKLEYYHNLAPELNQLIDYIYLYHEVHEAFTHEERIKVNQIVKEYFPSPKTFYYWGGGGLAIGMDDPFNGKNSSKKGRQHYFRPNLLNDEFTYGEGESDLIMFSIYRRQDSAPLDLETPLISFQNQYEIVSKETPEIPIWVLVHWGSDNGMQNQNLIWEPNEINAFGNILSSLADKIDGVFWRHGHGGGAIDFYASGFEEKREAFAQTNQLLRGYSIVRPPGDANGDGKVNGADLEFLKQDYLGEPVHNTDFNSDGRVDIQDFAVLQSNYKENQ